MVLTKPFIQVLYINQRGRHGEGAHVKNQCARP
jgi:hypothetical protein